MSTQINHVCLGGNLTRDPELRTTNSGTPVCSIRIANNRRRKDASGEWTDRPNYIDVTIWGAKGEAIAQHFSKGKPIVVSGELQWREWENDKGEKRQNVEVVAWDWQFAGGEQQGSSNRAPHPADDESAYGNFGGSAAAEPQPEPQPEPEPVGTGAQVSGQTSDDDIPF